MFSIEQFAESSELELLSFNKSRGLLACSFERLEETLVYLKNHLGFMFLTGINCEDIDSGKNVYYWLERIESGFSLGLLVKLDEGSSLASVSSLFKNAQGMEQEIAQKGVPLRALPRAFEGREFRKWKPKTSVEAAFVDEQVRSLEWLKGPLNPIGDIGVGVCAEDEFVTECKFQTDGLGSDFEKRLEGKGFESLARGLAKFDGHDGFVWSTLLHKAVEEGKGITIPDKAMAIRMIFIEFSRIMSHLEFCASVALELESQTFYFKMLEWSSGIGKLQRLYTGNYLNVGVLAFGGANREPPANWISTCLKHLVSFKSQLESYTEKITQSVLWRQCAEVGVVDSKTLISWGVSGPALRASGINFDLRKRKPFYLYDEVDFDTPIGINGSLFDRLLVRLQEISQSSDIIIQVLDNLPTGDLVAKDALHFRNVNPWNEPQESEYRDSISKPLILGEEIYQDSLEASSGLANLFVRGAGDKAESVYLGNNGLGKLLCLEEIAKGTHFESLHLLLKSIHVNFKTVGK